MPSHHIPRLYPNAQSTGQAHLYHFATREAQLPTTLPIMPRHKAVAVLECCIGSHEEPCLNREILDMLTSVFLKAQRQPLHRLDYLFAQHGIMLIDRATKHLKDVSNPSLNDTFQSLLNEKPQPLGIELGFLSSITHKAIGDWYIAHRARGGNEAHCDRAMRAYLDLYPNVLSYCHAQDICEKKLHPVFHRMVIGDIESVRQSLKTSSLRSPQGWA